METSEIGNVVIAGTETVSVLLARIDEKLTRALETDKDHEVRIRSLEHKVWTAAGLMSLVSAGITSIIIEKVGG